MSFICNPYILTPPTFVNAKSLSFDGTNETVNISDDASLDFDRTDTFSVSFWIYIDTSGNTEGVLGKRETGSSGYRILKDTNDRLKFQLINTSGDLIDVRMPNADSLNTSTWYHIVFTYDGTSAASGFTCYRNNSTSTLTTVTDTLASGSTTNNVDLRLGATNSTSVLYMDGNLDEVSFWDKELTSGEVNEIYNSGTPTDLDDHSASGNRISWWQMGDGDTISTITDRVGSNDGTPANMDASNITTNVP